MKLQSPINRKVITSVGYTFVFKKNEPQEIPALAVQACLANGCHVVEGEVLEVEERKIVRILQGPERSEAIAGAMRKLVARNGRDDFTGAGKPNAVVLTEMLAFQVHAKERDVIWQAVTEEIGEES